MLRQQEQPAFGGRVVPQPSVRGADGRGGNLEAQLRSSAPSRVGVLGAPQDPQHIMDQNRGARTSRPRPTPTEVEHENLQQPPTSTRNGMRRATPMMPTFMNTGGHTGLPPAPFARHSVSGRGPNMVVSPEFGPTREVLSRSFPRRGVSPLADRCLQMDDLGRTVERRRRSSTGGPEFDCLQYPAQFGRRAVNLENRGEQNGLTRRKPVLREVLLPDENNSAPPGRDCASASAEQSEELTSMPNPATQDDVSQRSDAPGSQSRSQDHQAEYPATGAASLRPGGTRFALSHSSLEEYPSIVARYQSELKYEYGFVASSNNGTTTSDFLYHTSPNPEVTTPDVDIISSDVIVGGNTTDHDLHQPARVNQQKHENKILGGEQQQSSPINITQREEDVVEVEEYQETAEQHLRNLQQQEERQVDYNNAHHQGALGVEELQVQHQHVVSKLQQQYHTAAAGGVLTSPRQGGSPSARQQVGVVVGQSSPQRIDNIIEREGFSTPGQQQQLFPPEGDQLIDVDQQEQSEPLLKVGASPRNEDLFPSPTPSASSAMTATPTTWMKNYNDVGTVAQIPATPTQLMGTAAPAQDVVVGSPPAFQQQLFNNKSTSRGPSSTSKVPTTVHVLIGCLVVLAVGLIVVIVCLVQRNRSLGGTPPNSSSPNASLMMSPRPMVRGRGGGTLHQGSFSGGSFSGGTTTSSGGSTTSSSSAGIGGGGGGSCSTSSVPYSSIGGAGVSAGGSRGGSGGAGASYTSTGGGAPAGGGASYTSTGGGAPAGGAPEGGGASYTSTSSVAGGSGGAAGIQLGTPLPTSRDRMPQLPSFDENAGELSLVSGGAPSRTTTASKPGEAGFSSQNPSTPVPRRTTSRSRSGQKVRRTPPIGNEGRRERRRSGSLGNYMNHVEEHPVQERQGHSHYRQGGQGGGASQFPQAEQHHHQRSSEGGELRQREQQHSSHSRGSVPQQQQQHLRRHSPAARHSPATSEGEEQTGTQVGAPSTSTPPMVHQRSHQGCTSPNRNDEAHHVLDLTTTLSSSSKCRPRSNSYHALIVDATGRQGTLQGTPQGGLPARIVFPAGSEKRHSSPVLIYSAPPQSGEHSLPQQATMLFLQRTPTLQPHAMPQQQQQPTMPQPSMPQQQQQQQAHAVSNSGSTSRTAACQPAHTYELQHASTCEQEMIQVEQMKQKHELRMKQEVECNKRRRTLSGDSAASTAVPPSTNYNPSTCPTSGTTMGAMSPPSFVKIASSPSPLLPAAAESPSRSPKREEFNSRQVPSGPSQLLQQALRLRWDGSGHETYHERTQNSQGLHGVDSGIGNLQGLQGVEAGDTGVGDDVLEQLPEHIDVGALLQLMQGGPIVAPCSGGAMMSPIISAVDTMVMPDSPSRAYHDPYLDGNGGTTSEDDDNGRQHSDVAYVEPVPPHSEVDILDGFSLTLSEQDQGADLGSLSVTGAPSAGGGDDAQSVGGGDSSIDALRTYLDTQGDHLVTNVDAAAQVLTEAQKKAAKNREGAPSD
ncbi:unnamed protein product [Amoebophrya sp. A25]|nr:unnamed protein product [Amoebophrya sp. A25]|eukprot:GSA25T00006755001.1